MTKPFKGVINLDIVDSVPDWEPFKQPEAPEGAPNVLYICLDDVGYSAMSCYGGLIDTPNIDKLAKNGLLYTRFHTTALCSPTRSCLLTGRNHTTNGMACIAEATSGFPNSNGHIPFECATIAEVLSERGYNTFMLGKWHLCPEDEMNLAATKRNWPVGRGFERFYGFLGGETHQFYPDLIYDNHPVDQPKSPEEGYHFTDDMTDKAIAFINDAKAIAPNKPFFMYYCPGATHAPHHAPKEWIEKYRGKFDMGYEKCRELVLERQKKMGIVPKNAEIPPINPLGDKTYPPDDDGLIMPSDYTKPWDSLSDDEKKLFCRMAEVYAGFLAHTDHHVGRLMDYLEEAGQLDNTLVIVVSDNGASPEGGPDGSVNENKFFNSIPDDLQENLAMLDELGGPKTYGHMPNGWAMAFNTPFKMFKGHASFNGGICDPFIIHWPKGIKDKGKLLDQYHHCIDVVPTIYECIGLEMPEMVKGYPQIPVEGQSMKYSFDDIKAPGIKQIQFYSMLGTRGIWFKGWKAVARHGRILGKSCFPEDEWELYNVDEDISEVHNLADKHPEKLKELINLWFNEAGKYNGLPLESRNAVTILGEERPQLVKARDRYIYYPGGSEIPESVAINTRNRSYEMAAEVVIPKGGAEGVIFSHGSLFGGHALYVKDGKLKYCYNFVGSVEQIIESKVDVPAGEVILGAEFVKDREEPKGTAHGTLNLYINEKKVGEGQIKTQPGKFTLGGEGLNVGIDPASPVTEDYPGSSPFAFTGTIKHVIIDVSGEPYADLEMEALGMMKRE